MKKKYYTQWCEDVVRSGEAPKQSVCGVCHEQIILVERNILCQNPGVWLRVAKSSYDIYSCPYVDEKWHIQALNLIRKMEDARLSPMWDNKTSTVSYDDMRIYLLMFDFIEVITRGKTTKS